MWQKTGGWFRNDVSKESFWCWNVFNKCCFNSLLSWFSVLDCYWSISDPWVGEIFTNDSSNKLDWLGMTNISPVSYHPRKLSIKHVKISEVSENFSFHVFFYRFYGWSCGPLDRWVAGLGLQYHQVGESNESSTGLCSCRFGLRLNVRQPTNVQVQNALFVFFLDIYHI